MDLQEIKGLNSRFAKKSPQIFLTWALEKFGDRMVVLCGLGPEGLAILDMIDKIVIREKIKFPTIVTIDTKQLFPETYELLARIEKRYGTIVRLEPDPAGLALNPLIQFPDRSIFTKHEASRQDCCDERKIKPLKRFFREHPYEAVITGLRQDPKAPKRKRVPLIQIDPLHEKEGVIKLNPLAKFTADKVWRYIRDHEVDHNALHEKGYASIGCRPCTDPAEGRDGRFAFEENGNKECALHLKR